MECIISNRVLMVRPATFYFNEETAQNNSFQTPPASTCDKSSIHETAIAEFDGVVNLLRDAGVTVEVINEKSNPITADSVFPNNWISYHCEKTASTDKDPSTNGMQVGTVDKIAVVYPMWAPIRRVERRKLISLALEFFTPGTTTLDLSPLENQGRFLEGTGSLVLDRRNRIAYACLSPRTSQNAVELFCRRLGYKPLMFNGVDSTGKPCYHTNVMMSIADKYAVICLEWIVDPGERTKVEETLKNSGKVVIDLTQDQVNQFAGNCLQLRGNNGQFLVMSSRAYGALTEEQIDTIQKFDKILHADVATIEKYGGGSVRCMIAELGEAQ